MTSDRAFEAPDLIEVMDEAVKYNRFLVEQLLAWSKGLGAVLDFGAGNGRFAIALHEQGVDVHAIEPDPDLRRKIGALGVRAYESLEALGGRRFDGIYTVNVLEHLEDDRACLENFYRSLVAGGRLLTYVPAFDALFSANDERVGHLRRYRKRTLVNKIRNAGFIVEQASYVDCIGFLAALAYRSFGDEDGGLDIRTLRLYDRLLFPVSRVLDGALGQVFGKNLLVRAVRPDSLDSRGTRLS